MTAAIMQPYFFPYIGYMQMVKAVDEFVFYDDVNFIKRGWINRNRILINNDAKYITIPLVEASQNKLINEIEINNKGKDYSNILKTIELAYKKAPFFYDVFGFVEQVLCTPHKTISDLARHSVECCAKYLNIDTKFSVSSAKFPHTKGLDRALRLQKICQELKATHYINAIGGQELYNKQEFISCGIILNFIKANKPMFYRQFNNTCIENLSIIDVMMFNEKAAIKEYLNDYQLL